MGFTKLQRQLAKSLFLFLLPAVIWLFVNASINWHVHILPGGYMISHAHPYKKAPSGSFPFERHDHTRAELVLFSLISDPVAHIVILFFSGLCLISVLRIVKTRDHFTEPAREYFQVNNYHAPPFP
jgi:hypothetical protein